MLIFLQDKEEEKSGSDDDDEDETSEEETTDSEEEEGARLKPVFVRKKVTENGSDRTESSGNKQMIPQRRRNRIEMV